MIKGILLAAGQSSRFGSQKLMAPLPDGTPIGLRSALVLAAAVDSLTVITRVHDSELKKHFTTAGLTCLDCEAAGEGMSASLRTGIGATRDACAWLIALADMPFIRPATLQAVVAALRRGHGIVQPTLNGRGGHPVGFQRRYREELMALEGDRGGREILHRHRNDLHRIAVDDTGVLRDVDTPADLGG